MKAPQVLDNALALLIASTLRKKRPSSIVAVSDAITTAIGQLGTLEAVSDRVGVSAKMLGQFLRVKNLEPSVFEMVENRLIDSVDVVAHLAQLGKDDQLSVATAFSSKSLSTGDVRAIVELRNRSSDAAIEDIITKVQEGKSKKVYIFEFVVRGGDSAEQLRSKLNPAVGSLNILNLSVQGAKGRLTLNPAGYASLRDVASQRGVPLKSILPELLRA